ncbi:hypothetical protein CR513_20250, partial [Mucuna pruriens]
MGELDPKHDLLVEQKLSKRDQLGHSQNKKRKNIEGAGKGSSHGILRLSQENYISKVLDRFDMKDSKLEDTPIAKGDKFSLKQCHNNDLKRKKMQKIFYALTLESLMYAQVCNHPDIAFVVGVLGRHPTMGYDCETLSLVCKWSMPGEAFHVRPCTWGLGRGPIRLHPTLLPKMVGSLSSGCPHNIFWRPGGWPILFLPPSPQDTSCTNGGWRPRLLTC